MHCCTQYNYFLAPTVIKQITQTFSISCPDCKIPRLLSRMPITCVHLVCLVIHNNGGWVCPFFVFLFPSEITRSAFFARRTRKRVCGSVDSINDSMCQQEYWRWLGSIDTCLRIHRHMHNAHLYNTRLDTTSTFRNSGLHLSQPSQPCAELSLHIFEASSSLIHKCWRYTLAL